MEKPPVCANNGIRKNLGKSDDPYDDAPIGGDEMDNLLWDFENQKVYKSLTDYLLARLVVAAEKNQTLLDCIWDEIREINEGQDS